MSFPYAGIPWPIISLNTFITLVIKFCRPFLVSDETRIKSSFDWTVRIGTSTEWMTNNIFTFVYISPSYFIIARKPISIFTLSTFTLKWANGISAISINVALIEHPLVSGHCKPLTQALHWTDTCKIQVCSCTLHTVGKYHLKNVRFYHCRSMSLYVNQSTSWPLSQSEERLPLAF